MARRGAESDDRRDKKRPISPSAAAAAATLTSSSLALPPHMRGVVADASSAAKYVSPGGFVAASALTALGGLAAGCTAASSAAGAPSSSSIGAEYTAPKASATAGDARPTNPAPDTGPVLISSLPTALLHTLLAGLQLQREQFKALRLHASHTFSPDEFLVRLNMCASGTTYVGAQIVTVNDDEVRQPRLALACSALRASLADMHAARVLPACR